jgi:hypothetical protein
VNLDTHIPRVKELPSKWSFGHAVWQISTDCWIEVSRNDLATVTGFRTSLTVRRSYATSRGLRINPTSICLITWIHKIAGWGLLRVRVWFGKKRCIHKQGILVPRIWSKVIDPVFLERTADITAYLLVFVQFVGRWTTWISLKFSSSKMVQHTTRQENQWQWSRISSRIEVFPRICGHHDHPT